MNWYKDAMSRCTNLYMSLALYVFAQSVGILTR